MFLSLIYFGILLVVEASPKLLDLGDSAASPLPKCWDNVGTTTPRLFCYLFTPVVWGARVALAGLQCTLEPGATPDSPASTSKCYDCSHVSARPALN